MVLYRGGDRGGIKDIAPITGQIFMVAVECRWVARKCGDPMALIEGLVDQVTADRSGGAENDDIHI